VLIARIYGPNVTAWLRLRLGRSAGCAQAEDREVRQVSPEAMRVTQRCLAGTFSLAVGGAFLVGLELTAVRGLSSRTLVVAGGWP
jgi:hypothetical protein